MLDETQDITVEVRVSEFPKCARCYRRIESVDKDPVFPAICHRCASEMHSIFYDLNHGYHATLPIGLTRDVNEFIKEFVRPDLKGMRS